MADTTRFAFSKRRLEALPAPGTGRRYLYDAKVPSLAFCITAAGSRSYYVYRWHEGKPVRVRLAGFEELTVENARKAAQRVLNDFAAGINPQDKKRTRREEMTLGRLFSHWLEVHSKPHKRTWRKDESQYNRLLKGWAGRRLSSISKGDVAALHARVGEEHGHIAANRMLALLRSMYYKADEIGYEGPNPAARIRKFPETSRDRYLGADELPKFFAAMARQPEDYRDAFTIGLLTGARWGNVAAMAWEEISLDLGIWRIPEGKAKAKVAIHVPLAPYVLNILHRRLASAGGSPWVFPSRRGKSGHMTEPKHRWREVCAEAGLRNLRVHDLRRTFGSWQAATGASLPVIGKSLGHLPGSAATAIYARLAIDPVRQSVETATAAMLAVIEPEKDEKQVAGEPQEG